MGRCLKSRAEMNVWYRSSIVPFLVHQGRSALAGYEEYSLAWNGATATLMALPRGFIARHPPGHRTQHRETQP
jgi:hypothetical protein